MSEPSATQISAVTALGLERSFPFLQLPPEIRCEIYGHLYWWKGNSDCGGAFSPWISPYRPLRRRRCGGSLFTVPMRGTWALEKTHNFKTLSAVSRSCKTLHQELIPLMYAPTYGFFDTGHFRSVKKVLSLNKRFRSLFFFDGGPARYLRRVRVKFTGDFPYSRTAWPPKLLWDNDPMIDPEILLCSLARNATSLERLDLDYDWSFQEDVFYSSRWKNLSETIAQLSHEFSWANPLLQIDLSKEEGEPRGGQTVSGETIPKEKQLDIILELLAPGNEELQMSIRERVEVALPDAEGSRAAQDLTRERLYLVETIKLFWGVRLVGILKGFNPTLRTVGLAAPVDERWIAKVRDEVGVKVKTLPWSVFHPQPYCMPPAARPT